MIGSALLAAGLIASVALAVPVLDANGTIDLNVASRSASNTKTTTAGAIVEYIGDSSPDGALGSAGTGVFVPFVRLQASPNERGFNTNAPVTFDAKTGTWTHAILVSQIPIVTIGGVNYWELFVDINDSNNAKHISLDEMEIWFTNNANLTGYVDNGTGFPAASGATKQYDFSGTMQFNDVNQGSGRGDVRYLVPLTNIPLPPAGTYFVLWSKWGTSSATYGSDGGFEEWKVKAATPPNAPTIATTLSANPVDIGETMHDSAALTGATATAGGTVTYSAYAGANTCSGTDLLNSTVTVTNGVVPDSAGISFSSAGTYSFQATYSGDARNLPATSVCSTEQLVVSPNAPSLGTTPSNDLGLIIGTTLQDSATLTGASSPTGSIVFNLYGPDDVDCDGTAVYTETVPLTGNSAATTTGYLVTAAGTYAWTADYAGDVNNAEAHSGCTAEEVTIAPNTPAPHSTPVVEIKDTFSVDGFAAPAAGAPDVHVGLYLSSDCTTDQVGSDETFAVPAAGGTLTDETSFVAALADDYYFLISYAGDANNDPFSSCDEHVGVSIDSLP